MPRPVLWFWVAVLLGASSSASAGPACKPNKKVIVLVDQRVEKGTKLSTASTTLYANGAWVTKRLKPDGKLAWTREGCLSSKQLAYVNELLDAATWKVSQGEKSCSDSSPRYTDYTVRKHRVFTSHPCSADQLDAPSNKALTFIKMLVGVPTLDVVQRDGTTLEDDGCSANPQLDGCR